MKKLLLAFSLIIGLSVSVHAQGVPPGAYGPGGGGGSGTVGTGAVVGPVMNVTLPSTLCPGCTAKADWRTNGTTHDGACTNSANNWSSASIAMTSADVGKKLWAGSSGTTVTAASGLFQFTIASVASATTWTTTENTSGANCQSNLDIFIATDNAAVFNAAELAIHNGTKQGVIYYPCGDYGIASAIWNQSTGTDSIMYLGGGATAGQNTTSCTTFHISPNVWGQSAGVTVMQPLDYLTMRDIALNGDGLATSAAATNGVLMSWAGADRVEHFSARNFRLGASTQILCQEDTDNGYFADPSCGVVSASGTAWQYHSLDSTVIRPTFVGCPGADVADLANSVTIGGVIAASAGGCRAMSTLSNTGPTQNTVWQGTHFSCSGSAATPCVDITKPGANAMNVTLRDDIYDNIGTSNQVLLNVGAGATVLLSGSTPRGTGTTPTITNAGTIIDGCGNQLGNTLTGVGVTNNCAAEPSIAGRCLLTSQAGPLACVQTSNGRVAVPATTTTYTINTTAPATGSFIAIVPTTDNSGIPGAPTCGAEVFADGTRSATSTGTSFTFTMASAAVIKCYDWSIR